jgi:hypothetical protein
MSEPGQGIMEPMPCRAVVSNASAWVKSLEPGENRSTVRSKNSRPASNVPIGRLHRVKSPEIRIKSVMCNHGHTYCFALMNACLGDGIMFCSGLYQQFVGATHRQNLVANDLKVNRM